MWFYMIIGVFLIVMGLMVHVFKWHFLISGYNTMPKEQKEKVDAEGLGRLIGIYFYVNGGVLIGMGVLRAFGVKVVLIPSIVFFSISTIYMLIKAQKYDGNVYGEDGKLRKGAWKQFILPVSIISISSIFVVLLLFFSSQPTKVTFVDEGVQIHGMYGDIYSWDSIKTVRLMEELPTIERRTNGSAVNSTLKGYFRTKEMGSVKLFVNTQKRPFVYFETKDEVVIFNTASADETQEIFGEMQKRVK